MPVVASRLVGRFFLIAFFVFSLTSYASVEDPDIETWVTEWIRATKSYPGFLRRILILNQDNDKIKVVDSTMERCASSVYFLCENSADVIWTRNVNSLSKTSAKSLTSWWSHTVADSLVLTRPNDLLIYQRGRAKPISIQGLAVKDENSLEDIFDKLGYDGVVLGLKGDFVLIGSSTKRLGKSSSQALALADTEKDLILSSARRNQGAVLLVPISQKGPFAIFQSVLKSKNLKSIPIGSKVIIE
jgi:hypothetical protein